MMLLQFCALISVFYFAEACPLRLSDSSRCRCTSEEYRKGAFNVECSNIETEDDLSISMLDFRGMKISDLRIKNSLIRAMQPDVFRDIEVRSLYFENCSIETFSDTNCVAFEGLEDSLSVLSLLKCDYMDSWDWTLFRKHRVLEYFKLRDSDMKAVRRSQSRERSQLKISYVNIDNSGVSYVGDDAFGDFDGLGVLYMKSNKLRHVKRSMLPNPANELVSLDLSFNRLSTLPEDFFENMPGLKSLYLKGNEFYTLREDTFAPVWYNLRYFYAEDNKIKCDCDVKWILQKPNKLNILRVTCYDHLGRNKNIKDFKDTSHLSCSLNENQDE